MKKRKANLLRKIMAALFAVVLLTGMVPSDALALEADKMSYTLNITIEGYEGNDPAVLGAVTLKRLAPTQEEWEVPSMTGNVITCTVEPPVITKQPGVLVCPTTTYARLNIAASGDNLTYQWQVNRNDGVGFVDIAGETSATIIIRYPTESQDGHLYRCVVTNAGGSVTGDERELVVSNVRVRKAKQAVQDALDEMIVTNDTDVDSIQNIADAALSNAGITMVSVTIYEEAFSKTEATEDAEGNVSAEMSIECYVSSGYVKFSRDIPRLSHTCSLSLVSKAEPDCTATGKKAYYHCASCGKNYADAEGTALIADLVSWGNMSALGHDYETKWSSDEENHWHACSRCDAKTDVSAHAEDDGTVTREPTETESGIRTYCCSVCHKELRTEAIPATGSNEEPGGEAGKVDKEVERGKNAPATQFFTPVNELADMILTPEEKQQIADGTDIKIILDVKDASGSVSSSDKAAVEAALNGFAAGQYIDISLFKVTGENRSAISETQGKIMITIAVPDSLKNTDSNKTRTYAVIRVHNGQAEILNDLDGDGGTITIATDKFSIYAIVYKDTSNGVEEGNDSSTESDGKTDTKTDTTDSGPKTGDDTPVVLYAFIAMLAGFSCLLLYTERRYDMTRKIKK